METNNETVAEVCREISYSHEGMIGIEFRCIADRIFEAHKREMAAKDDARLTVVSNYENVIAAKDRTIAAKDAEIGKLRALVKELADALEPMICIESCDACDALAGSRMDACRDERARHNALIAKAREVVK